MKKPYNWIIFDADDTLFHWDDFRGLKSTFSHYQIDFTEQDYLDYQAVNKPLWVEYEKGHMTVENLYITRFQAWGEKLQMHPLELNNAFMEAMREVCMPLDGAIELIHALHDKTQLAIISNGFTDLQYIRLEKAGIKEFFKVIVISEQLGIAKPDPRIFDHALNLMGQPKRDNVLMVGDNPHADILGAQNAALHTCWLNVHKNPLPEGIHPHYQISCLNELQDLLLHSSYFR